MNAAQLLPSEVLRDESDPVLDFEASIEQAARAVDAEPWLVQRLKHPEREITLNLPLVRDDGSVVNVTAYRVQHSRAKGPTIGPVILSPNSHVAKLRMIATQITLQSALLGLRFGGAAGAIVIDPEQYSERELRHLVREYVFALRDAIGPLRDVLVSPHLPKAGRCEAPENLINQWMEEANTHAKGFAEPAAVVGSEELLDAIGSATADPILQAIGSAGAPARVAIQGFGTRGRSLARALHARGAKILAVADRSGGLFHENGIGIEELAHYVHSHGVVFGFPAATAVSNADVLECECDALVLAAGERQVGSYNATNVRARALVELTQGAVTTAGAESLPSSCTYIPHLIAGAAELAVWEYEWRKALTYSATYAREAQEQTEAVTLHAFDDVRRERRRDWTAAALIAALANLPR